MLSSSQITQFTAKVRSNSTLEFNSMLLKSFGDPTCFKILYILTASAFVCPSDFAKILDLSRPAISHHLTRLRQLGVVTSVRHGQVLCYSLTDTKEAQALRNVLQLLLK